MSEHVKPPAPRIVKLTWAIALTAVVLVAGFVIYLAIWGSGQQQAKDQEQSNKNQAQSQTVDLAQKVQEVCKAGGAPAVKLQQAGLCGQTKQIVEQGPAGAQGEKGDPGEVGAQGPKGDKGDKGDPGQSPPCLIQANHCVGATGATGAVGPIGATGPIGPQGLAGKDGAEGPKGDTGATGATGDTGPAGPAGQDGAPGKDGATGAPGADGKDGANAYPFTFTFAINSGPPLNTTTTYTCTVENPATTAQCTQAQP